RRERRARAVWTAPSRARPRSSATPTGAASPAGATTTGTTGTAPAQSAATEATAAADAATGEAEATVGRVLGAARRGHDDDLLAQRQPRGDLVEGVAADPDLDHPDLAGPGGVDRHRVATAHRAYRRRRHPQHVARRCGGHHHGH